MKKILAVMLVMAVCLGMGCYARETSENHKQIQKEQKAWQKKAQKLASAQLKTIKKEKWKTNATVPLKDALVQYYLATEPTCGGTGRGIAVDANNAKSVSLGERRLLTNAQNSYVQEMQAMVIGEVAEHMASRNEEGDEIVISDVRTKIKDELQGDVRRAFTLYKENKNGTYWVRGYFIIDEEQSAAKIKKLTKRLEKDEAISNRIKRNAATSESE